MNFLLSQKKTKSGEKCDYTSLNLKLFFHFKVYEFQFTRNYYEITPEPISSSPRCQATNCPSVIADCGSSKATYMAFSN
jgi:hypothetical protein